jgi:hypothetical protein
MADHPRLLFNHDGWCVFMQASPYQRIDDAVGLAQVRGYVDEVADCGCDALLLSPVMSKIPLWPSEVCPHWREQAGSAPREVETKADVCYNRMKEFVDAGHDLVRLSAERARQKGIAFYISWRMNEGHDVRRDGSPLQSRFWREHPEFRIGGPDARSLWGRAMDFSHPEVRDYQFALIRELCTRYSVDGLELDFVRFGKFFPTTTAEEERFRILGGFVERVRRMLDDEAGGVPLCARVPSRPDLAEEMGLDVAAWAADGLLQMVNVAPFIVTQPDAEIEEYRAALPGAALYGEITHCTHYGRLIETGVFEERKITREIVLSTAHSFLERGCDGLSTFNYVYTRDFTFGRTGPEEHREPDFEALSHCLDRDYLCAQPKHYVLTDDRYSRQLPVRLNVEDEVTFRLHVADDLEDPGVRTAIERCVLRVETEASSPPAEFEVVLDELPLEPTRCEGDLFPVPECDRVAVEAGHRGDFLVPLDLLRRGWNEFTVRLVSTPMVTVERVELALYRDRKHMVGSEEAKWRVVPTSCS